MRLSISMECTMRALLLGSGDGSKMYCSLGGVIMRAGFRFSLLFGTRSEKNSPFSSSLDRSHLTSLVHGLI